MNESFKVVAEFVDGASAGLAKLVDTYKEFAAGVMEGAKAELELIKAGRDQGNQADKSANQTQNLAKEIAKLAAEVYTVKQIIDAFVNSLKDADKLDDLSDKTGIAAADLKELGFAAKLGGSSLDGLVKAFDKLGKNANLSEEDVKKQAQAFEQLGVSVTDSTGQIKDSNKLFEELADAFAGIEDGPEKSAAAFRIFGAESKNLLPLLNQGADGIRKMREEATELGGMSKDSFNAFAKATGELFDRLDKLQLVFAGLFDTMNAELVPVLNIFLDQIIASAKEGGILRDVINGIEYAFKNGVIPVLKIGAIALDGFTSVIKIAAKGLGALGAAMVLLLNGDFAGVKQVFNDYKADVSKIADEHVKFQEKLTTTGEAAAKMADNVEKPKRKIQAMKKDVKEVTSELEKMLQSLTIANQSFGQDESTKQRLEAQAKYYKDVKTLGQARAAALYAEVDAQIELNRALREGQAAQEAYIKAQAGIDQIKAANDEIAFEITLVGKSADERKRLIELRKEELKIQLLQKGLTAESAAAIAAEGKAALEARENLLKARDDAQITNEILDASYAKILADVQRRLIIASTLLENGKITADDYLKYVDKQMERLKDKTKEDLSELQLFWQEAGKGIQNVLASAFEDIANGSLKDLDKKIAQTITRIVAQMLAAKAAIALFGNDFGKGQIGGYVGQFAGFVGGLFGGARASGGRVEAGKSYLVGEYGPEPFVPSVSGTVLPTSSLEKKSTTVNFTITAMDSKDVLANLSKVKTELSKMIGGARTNYNLSGAY